MPELMLRLFSAIVLAAVALAAVIASPWSFLALVVVAGGLLAWEWGSLTRGNGFDGTALIEAVCVTAVAILVAMGHPDLALLILGGTAATIGFGNVSKPRAAWALAGLAYVALPAWSLVWLRSDPSLGLTAILYVLAVAWTTDTASYVGGRLLGGPKLSPRISPKKTWSGFIVGTITPALVGYGFATYLGGTSAWLLALVSIGLALACQIGDLLESAIKRHFGAKDMSQLIPGHGGLFDRIDSLLLASVVAALIALRNIAEPGAGLLIW
ncbi:MAG TPA: phosphatidate cytidylyltransferase [Methyloceanibacter sp.]|nr:phosphatidate cytidylyltransferase [Methyloceanibacter sp.]